MPILLKFSIIWGGFFEASTISRYLNMTQDLQRVNICELSENEKLAFFLNLYNAMVIHAVISVGSPEGIIDRRSFFNDFLYLIGGHPYSLAIIENGILRCNQRSPYSLMKPFSTGDKRLE
ncbi:ras GTPase activation domain-containing protein, partial [Trifolium medium]|nr:ras GTPase activation domain-containing protein [Trifolium medium]